MSDVEIFQNEIKCIKRRSEGKCDGGSDCAICDLLMDESEIISAYGRAIENANLIYEQQAEIERLKEDVSFNIKLNGLLQQQREGRDELICELDEQNDKLNCALQTAKSEAITEFAERVTEKADLIDANTLNPKWVISQDDIDNLVKEMTEGSKCMNHQSK